MLSNAYLLAKFRFDTSDNEPAKNLQKNEYKDIKKLQQKIADFANFAELRPIR